MGIESTLQADATAMPKTDAETNRVFAFTEGRKRVRQLRERCSAAADEDGLAIADELAACAHAD
jgi:hypothetical protein